MPEIVVVLTEKGGDYDNYMIGGENIGLKCLRFVVGWRKKRTFKLPEGR